MNKGDLMRDLSGLSLSEVLKSVGRSEYLPESDSAYMDLYNRSEWEDVGKLPEGKAVIYFFFNNDRICYIGKTISFVNRMSDHSRSKTGVDEFCYIVVDRDIYSELERILISIFNPPMNGRMTVKYMETKIKKNVGTIGYSAFWSAFRDKYPKESIGCMCHYLAENFTIDDIFSLDNMTIQL